jgi:N-acetylmuramoyl-L-alanine amidase
MNDSIQPCAAGSGAIDVLARTIYGEARGETVRGKEAVAAVVMNRLRRATDQPRRFGAGQTVESICRQPYQFSCWNAADVNRPAIEQVQAGNATFDCCVRIATRAVRNILADPTGGATHYHAIGAWPYWASGRKPDVIIGRHVFYKGID